MAIHTVSPGDTLWKISRVYGTSVSTLLRVNGLGTGALVPGLNLYIPQRGLPERFYRVKAGDTIWKIAQQYQTTIEAIVAANPTINLNNLRIGQRLRIPTSLRYRMETLMFMDISDPLPYLNILRANAKHITYLAIFTYSFIESGELIQAADEAILRESKQYNILPLMVISNFGGGAFSTNLADQVLRNASIRRKFIGNIVAAVENKGYAGVSIDFEFVSPARRNDFTTFLRELKTALGRRILQVNVHAKTNEDPSNSLTGFQDYKAIGQIVDHMAVMTLDYGYAAGSPQAIAPIWWIDQVLNFTTSQVNSRKVMMSINMYGYDWTIPGPAGTVAEMISANAAQNRAITNSASIQYDWQAQAPGYRYTREGREHAVWFEDIRSVLAKYELLEGYNLLGTTYWRLRFEFPQNFAYVNNNIQVIKQ